MGIYREILCLKLWQEGDNNKSTQKSWGIGNVSWLNQDGHNNTSTIVQDGDANSTKLYQSGDGGKVDVLQEGNSNIIAGLDMAETGNVYSLKARQLGENNELNISSTGTVTVMQDNTSSDMVGNKINYYQSGVGITKLSQVGDENFIGLLHGGNGNANIKQEGDNNKVGSFTNVFAYDPDLDEVGSGIFNGEKLNVNQLGASNLLHLSSSGLSDIVTVLQQGNNNAASVTQSGL